MRFSLGKNVKIPISGPPHLLTGVHSDLLKAGFGPHPGRPIENTLRTFLFEIEMSFSKSWPSISTDKADILVDPTNHVEVL